MIESFSKRSGTVVTGTVLGKKCELMKSCLFAKVKKRQKIKNIQVHNQNVLEANISSRAALNLQNVNITNLKRWFNHKKVILEDLMELIFF